MIVLRLVKRIDVGKVGICVVRAVIGDNIKHDPNVTIVAGLDEIFEVLRCSEVLIHSFPVKCSVPVVVCLSIVWNGRDPNSVEPHSSNVIKVLLNSLESAATILAQIRACSSYAICPAESISQELVDASAFPFFSSVCGSHCDQRRHK